VPKVARFLARARVSLDVSNLATLAELRANTLDEADLISGQIDDDDVDRIINEAIGELYEFLIQAYEGVFSAEATFSLAAVDAGSEDLPSDFYQATDLEDVTDPGNPVSLPTFEFKERNSVWSKGWCIHGGAILVRPLNSAVGNYRFTYVPSFTNLEEDDDITMPNGWIGYAVLTAAIRLKESQELSTSDLERRREAFETRIRNAVRKRVGPRRVRDARAQESGGNARRLQDWKFI
jgi:hypothetical protein